MNIRNGIGGYRGSGANSNIKLYFQAAMQWVKSEIPIRLFRVIAQNCFQCPEIQA